MNKRPFVYFSILLFLSFSCIPSKKVKYLQTIESANSEKKYVAENRDYKLQLGDNLYIDLSSIDPEIKQVLSSTIGNVSNLGAGAKYKDVYLISAEGVIDLPHVGSVQVNGYTLRQVRDTLSLHFSKLFNQVNIQVRLANGFITILGEVNRPGRYRVEYKNKISVYELLGMAGDLTAHANRNEVKIVRRVNNENTVCKIDLTKETVLADSLYYLQPNDIIYVEPLRAVFWDKKSFPFMTTLSLVLATVTSILVIITYTK